MSDVTLRIATPAEYPRIRAAYTAWGYNGGVAPDDVVYIAERGEALLGVVRRTLEHEVTMLRGMYIAPTEQRHGIGSQLLNAFVAELHDRRGSGLSGRDSSAAARDGSTLPGTGRPRPCWRGCERIFGQSTR